MADNIFGMKILPEIDSQGMAKVTKAIQEGLKGNILDSSTVKSFSAMAKASATSFNETIAKAKLAGLHNSASEWRDKMLKTQDDMLKKVQEMETMRAQLREKKITNKEYAAYQRRIKDEIQATGERMATEMRGADEAIKRREEAFDDWEKRWAGDSGKAMATGFEDGMKDMWSNIKAKDMGGLADVLGGILKKAGGGMTDMAGKAALAGEVGGGAAAGAGGMAAMLGPIGAVVIAIGAVVAAVSAVVALFFEADAQAKEFNSTLLQGASQADFFTGAANEGVMDLTDNLDAARHAALGLAWEFRGDAKEIMGVLSAANEAGLTFKEMQKAVGGNVTEQEAYVKVAKTAIIYSNTLGQSQETIATQTATWMEELGGGLRTVEDGFSAIFQGAMQSGIGVKRFYGMVTAATSNMAMYNIRIEEAAALMTELGKSLGETQAASFTEGLAKGFAHESYTERFKRILIAGQGDMKEIMENSAISTAEAFREKFGKEGSKGLAEAAGAIGIDMGAATGGDAKELAKLGQISEESFRKLLQATESKEEYRELEKLVEVSRGMSGGVSDQAKALDAMDMSGKLATVLSGGLGGKELSKMSALELAAFENYAGISGEQLLELRKVDRQLRGQFAQGQDMQKLFKKQGYLSEEQNAKLKDLGLEMGENGKLYVKSSGKEVDSFNDYVQSQGDMLEAAVETAMTDMEALAKRQVEDTSSILNALDTGLQYMLENIYDVLQSLLSWTMGLDASEREAKDALVDQLRSEEKSLLGGLRENAEELGAARDLARTAKDDERAAAKEQIKVLETERESIESGLAGVRIQVQRAGQIEGAGPLGSKSIDDMRAEVQTISLEDIKMRMDPDQLAAVIEAGQQKGSKYLKPKYGGSQTVEEAEAYIKADYAKTGQAGSGVEAAAIRGMKEIFEKERRAGEEGQAQATFDTGLARRTLEEGETRRAGGITAAGREWQKAGGVPWGDDKQNITEKSLKAAAMSGELTASRIEDLVTAGLINEKLQSELITLEGDYAKKQKEATVATEATTSAVEEATRTRVADDVKSGELVEIRRIARMATGGKEDDEFRMVMDQLKQGRGSEVAGTYSYIPGMIEALGAQGYTPKEDTFDQTVEDFIYRGGATGGTITSINSADELLGAKPGGPVDKALGGRGNSFVFHINGGDPAKVYAIVKKALRESGVRPPPGVG